MCDCCKKIRWGKVLVAGFLFLIIATVIRQIEAILTMRYYLIPEYFGVWSRAMMPKAGPPPTSFYLTSWVFSFITGVVLAGFYDLAKDFLGKTCCNKTCGFTCIMVALSLVFFSLPAYLLFNLPLVLLMSWFISSVIVFYLVAVVFGKVLR